MDGDLLGNEFGRELGRELAPLIVIWLLIVGALFLVAIVWLVAVIGLVRGYRADGVWRARRRKMIVLLSVSTPILLICAVGMFMTPADSSHVPDPHNEKDLVSAAVAKVRSQFANPNSVQVKRVWLGSRGGFEMRVCGMVDSDEITNASEFIFTTYRGRPPLSFSHPGATGWMGDEVIMRLPPAVEGAKPADTSYWEKVGRGFDWFDEQWNQQCAKTAPADES